MRKQNLGFWGNDKDADELTGTIPVSDRDNTLRVSRVLESSNSNKKPGREFSPPGFLSRFTTGTQRA